MTAGELALARSVLYASLFDYPLTIDELHRTLIESDLTVPELLGAYRASPALQRMIGCRDGFFFPAGRHDLVAERRQREARSRAFLDAHRLFLRVLCAVPFTAMVALSGSVAHLNLEERGDLDLFIVTRGRHVWSVGVATVLLAKLLRRRRTVCANFIVSDARLTLDQQDLFVANQAIGLRPLFGDETLEAFLAANPFVARFYPNARAAGGARPHVRVRVGRIKRTVEALLSPCAPLVEALCRTAYGWYLGRRAPSWRSPEQVQLRREVLKLHTRSHRRSILDRFALVVSASLAGAGERTGTTEAVAVR